MIVNFGHKHTKLNWTSEKQKVCMHIVLYRLSEVSISDPLWSPASLKTLVKWRHKVGKC